MNTNTKIKQFVKDFKASVQGDDVDTSATKALQQAQLAVKMQVTALGFQTMKLENAVVKAKENQIKARVNNGVEISDADCYVENLLTNRNKVVTAEMELEKHLTKIKFLEEELASFEKEVE